MKTDPFFLNAEGKLIEMITKQVFLNAEGEFIIISVKKIMTRQK
jgi:hypothetical protein